ncbi:unnamed protein product, partial [Oncorhynchus mykiss]
YRHVYLEGLTEASIFIHVSVHDIYGKGRQLGGIRGLFNRPSKFSVDTSCGSALRKRSISDHLLRRTASAPANRRKKTKMKLAESSTSISDRKASISDRKASISDGKASISDRKDRVRPTPLTHRPISMPLEGLLQGQLSLCSPDQEQTDLGADTHIGTSPFNQPGSHSVELVVESSASLEHKVFTPSINHNNAQDNTTESDQSDDTSYLVIGRGGGTVDAEGVSSRQRTLCHLSSSTETESNCLHVPSESRPETTLLSTTNTATSSSPSSELSISLLNVDRSDLQSPVHLQDSIISHLIDAVSLGNDTTNGSISALIGQFDLTGDQNDFTMNSDPHTLSVIQTPNHANQNLLSPHPKTSHTDPNAPLLFSSPETTELEEVYTILDEEVLSPVSVYNLKKQTIGNIQADSEENTPMGSLEPSPAKVPPFLGLSQCSSPVKQPSHQPSPRQAPLTTPQTQPSSCKGPPNPSPLLLNSHPSTHSRHNTRAFTQQHSYSGPIQPQTRSYQGGTGEGQGQGEASACFQNGHSTASASHYTQPQPHPKTDIQLQPLTQTQPQSDTQPKPQTQLQPQSGRPLLPLLGSTLTPPLPILRPSTAPSPCKSKSLGDLTSEDISCNFHSKYNIISRSFITPCMRERRRMRGLGGLSQRLQSADPLTEQLRKLMPPKPFIPPSCPSSNFVPDTQEDSPPLLSRRLSSRSQSRVRHINNRAREKQREALKPRDMSAPSSVGGVVLRTKVAACQNPPANRHSTGSYIAGYLDQLEERGLPEGGCTTLGYGYGDHYHDHSLLPTDSCIQSEPEVYFLLRL